MNCYSCKYKCQTEDVCITRSLLISNASPEVHMCNASFPGTVDLQTSHLTILKDTGANLGTLSQTG